MGFIKRWDVNNIVQQIHSATAECRSSHNDGFTAWYVKQDLLQIKEILDEAIQNCPSFGTTEEDWLREQEQRKIIRILKK